MPKIFVALKYIGLVALPLMLALIAYHFFKDVPLFRR